MELFKDKVVIITGGSQGIGYATAVKMAEEGAIVYACARREKTFDHDNIHYHPMDVTDEDSCRKLFEDIMEKHGKIDVLVANAGITKDAMTRKMTGEDFDSVINTNLKGIFNLVRYFGPKMEEQGYGSIVAVSSVV